MYATFPGREVSNKCGTGIGLMVCKKLIKLLGPSEKIDLWSEENKGTKMTF
jgi:signal transduction histidine kinase